MLCRIRSRSSYCLSTSGQRHTSTIVLEVCETHLSRFLTTFSHLLAVCLQNIANPFCFVVVRALSTRVALHCDGRVAAGYEHCLLMVI
jgi:hypothetical protein